MLSLTEIREHVIGKLTTGLSPLLTYHNLDHTLDVYSNVSEIARQEGIENEEELFLLKIGALYHDVGFLNIYSGHEERSCEVACNELTGFGFNKNQIEKICGLIRATRVPQQPNNLLEEIICDADLDYLGRDDFFVISDGLYKEFLRQHIVADEREWNLLQIRFLENHHYFTNSSKKRRQQAKQVNLQKVKERLA